MSARAASPRRLARILRAVDRLARLWPRRRGEVRPVDLACWRRTLPAAVALCPALPPRAWALALCGGWADDGACAAPAFAAVPAALANLAAAVAAYGDGASRVPRRAVTEAMRLLSRLDTPAGEGRAPLTA